MLTGVILFRLTTTLGERYSASMNGGMRREGISDRQDLPE